MSREVENASAVVGKHRHSDIRRLSMANRLHAHNGTITVTMVSFLLYCSRIFGEILYHRHRRMAHLHRETRTKILSLSTPHDNIQCKMVEYRNRIAYSLKCGQWHCTRYMIVATHESML
jgi:hypothetical protein